MRINMLRSGAMMTTNPPFPSFSREVADDLLARNCLKTRGAPLTRARAVMVLLHGRGATAESILDLADVIAPADIAWLAPQARGNTWYPFSFLSPFAQNEPHLTRAIGLVSNILDDLATVGVPSARMGLAGFSQGACLALETAVRHPRGYGALIALSGGLIGPPGTPRDYTGSLAGARAFLGCSDIDSHIPLARVQESHAVLTAMGADVTTRIYPGFGHAINEDEIRHARALLETMHG